MANLIKIKYFSCNENRFMWEDVEKGNRKNKRINTILKFENVMNVLSKNIDQVKKDLIFGFSGY